MQPGAYRTYANVVYTNDPCAFLALSTDEQVGLLLHEQMHAFHQFSYPGGPALFLRDVAASTSFRWQEESQGWALQLTYYVRHGVYVDQQATANFLANGYNNMISYEAALAWVSSVCAAAAR